MQSNNFREILLNSLIIKENMEEETESEVLKVKEDTSIKYSIIDGKVSQPSLVINIDEENVDSIDHLATIISNMTREDFIPQVLIYIEAGLRQQGKESEFTKLICAIQEKRDNKSDNENKPIITPSDLGETTIQIECLPVHNKYPHKVVWEKYENVVDKQIEVSKRIRNSLFLEDEGESDLHAPYKDSAEKAIEDLTSGPEDQDEPSYMFIPSNLVSDIRMMTIFDSWICYTNFDITKAIANKINSFTGVELFKVLTRYRFLLAVSKAFEFKEFVKDFNQEFGINNEQSNNDN